MLNLNANRSSPRFRASNVASGRYLRPKALLLVGVAVAMACSGGCPAGAPDDAPGFLGDLSDGDPTTGNSGTAGAGNGSDPGTAGDTQGNGLHVPDQQVFAMQGDSVEITLRLDGGADPDSDVRYAVVVAPAFGIITAGETREINTATLIYTPPADFAGNTAISYVARTNSGESNVATVSITVYPLVRFGVATLDERGLSVRCFAATLGGDPLPDGTYVWRFDDVKDSGLMSTHRERTHTFADAGIHTISLTIILAGLQGPIACRSIDDSELQIRKHVTPRVSGRVRLSDGQPVAGVSVRAGDGSVGDTTDEKGRYRFDVPLYWSGKVRAFREGYSFTPASIEIGNAVRDVRNAHFTASMESGSKPPVAYAQAVRTSQDTDLLITLTGSDPENDPLTYIVATLPAHGALFDAQRGYRIGSGDLPYALAANLATYSPAAGYSGSDAFRFRVSDGPNQSPDADIKIGVGQSNNAPLAHSQDVRVAEDRNVVVKLTGSDPDNDPLSFIIVELPTHGLLDDPQSGRRIGPADLPYLLATDNVRYTPKANYVGGDRFSFKVNDGKDDSAAGGVNLSVDGENDAPMIEQRNPFILTVKKDSKRTDPFNQFELSATDVDAAPNSLSWKILIAASHGSAWLDGGSPSSSGQPVQFSYEPAPGYGGRDGFTVEVSDAEGLTDTIQVQVAIGGYLLSGVVSDYNGNPSSGVPVEALDDNNNPWQTRVSDSNGLYEFLVPPGWSGTLTSDANYRFEPASKGYNNVSASSVQDFTAFRNYYVATTGDDGSSGFIDAEFATIQRAADVVAPGDTVFVRAGVYREQIWIHASGTPSRRIVFKNVPGDLAVVDAENSRSWCFIIGENNTNYTAGHYITVDGFECKNPAGPGFGGDGLAAGIIILGTNEVIIRNCHIYRDDYPGYPDKFMPLGYKYNGIWVQGHNLDTLIEYNTVHHAHSGIVCRLSGGDVGGWPIRPVLRGNHVSFCNIDDDRQQNNAVGLSFSNHTVTGLMEDNVVHHCGDAGISCDNTGGHLIQRNIAYLIDHMVTAGNGPGIKTKADGNVTGPDIVRYNVSFMNQLSGIEINVSSSGKGAFVYNNTSYGNVQKGITTTNLADPNFAVVVMNNMAAGNQQTDIKYQTGLLGIYDYNFEEDGNFSGTVSPHSQGGAPRLLNTALLGIDNNGDGTPDVLDRLNDPLAFPDARSAIAYARQQIHSIFGLQGGAPAIDAALDQDLGLVDLLGNQPYDDPNKPDPWSDDNDPGLYDVGALEWWP